MLQFVRKIRRAAARKRLHKLLLSSRAELSGDDIGRWSYGHLTVIRWSKNGALKVGRFCSFADQVRVLLGGEHNFGYASTFPFGVFLGGVARDAHEKTKGDVTIGHDVWVGRGATILSGITIGNGAVIGAESLVTKDVAPYSIVAGNPARLVRMRFDEETVRDLENIKWWDWSDEKLTSESKYLLNEDIAQFIARHKTGNSDNQA